MSGLTFDWDDVDFKNPEVQQALIQLCKIFGNKVWYRTSSSGTGLHVMIAELSYDTLFGMMLNPIPMATEQQFEYRQQFSEAPWNLECPGRFNSDQVRSAEGFRTSRVFVSKNGNTAGEWMNVSMEIKDVEVKE
tara:strand:- start:9911 stop:10312 length:402 start_codon:yes stop_codon:yes gene_type:complete